MRSLLVSWCGRMPYGEALELQREIAKRVIARDIDGDVLLLLEHPPVVTLGRSSKAAHVVASAELLAHRGVERFDVERGGDVTFHGPGQLVGYPIFDLKAAPHRQDLHWYLRQVEEALIQALATVGIHGRRNTGYTGVWVGNEDRPRKIASIGVHARDWVTWHGFAINVSTDLSLFDLIIPCGITGVEMTSIEKEHRVASSMTAISVEQFVEPVVRSFAAVFSLQAADGSAPLDRVRRDLAGV